MRCIYCYAAEAEGGHDKRDRHKNRVSASAVKRAAEFVARNCAEKNMPFRIVVHGGGEPSVHWDLVKQIEKITRAISKQFRIPWWGYIATNGILSDDQVNWLIDHFDLIGISCDGPPDIQNFQRPGAEGYISSGFVEHTTNLLHKKGKQYIVRTTITPQTADRQLEIFKYLNEKLGAKQIRFEPVYQIRGQGLLRFKPEHAGLFVENFIKARNEAQSRDCQLTYSGIQIDNVHGTYCDVLRNVLHLLPDGSISNCFFSINGDQNYNSQLNIGRYDEDEDSIIFNQTSLRSLKQKLSYIPIRCRQCVNIYHCSRECPEKCLITQMSTEQKQKPGFRCLVNRKLAEILILEKARILANENRKSAVNMEFLNVVES